MASAPPSGSAPASEPSSPEELKRRLAEYEALLEIGVELAGSLDPLRVMALALEKTEELCRAETGSIWEVDEERAELFFRVVRGRVAGEIRGLRVPLGAGIVGAVAASGRAELVNEVESDPRWRGDKADTFRTRAILAVPLVAHGRVIGVLQLLNPIGREAFTAGDLRRLRLFAGPLANALDNARLHAAQKRQFVETVTALAEAIEKRDPYTGGHVRRVVGYSLLLGREMSLSEGDLEQLRLGATLHDVGKIAVPDEVLRKPGPLDRGEFEVMKRHTLDGAEIVARVRGLRGLIPAVRSHHERLDGGGYPDGLDAERIPLLARIIAVADTYDAMTTDRPYRRGLAPAAAFAELDRHAGSQHAAEVVAAFRRLFERGEFTVEDGERLLASLSESGAPE
jgi:HD-GYP domain-containing protein (c-di-GMP phosphodiesterase class II)